MKLVTLTALVFATAALLSQTLAWAVKSTTYNGSYCKPMHGSQYAEFSYSGMITNLSAEAREIVCPILLHGFADQTGAHIYFHWLAANEESRLECWVYSLDTAGNVVRNDDDSTRGTGWLPPYTNQDQEAGLPQPALIITKDDSTYFSRCVLPPGGSITAIQVSENGSGE
jgi:hypothetical protein